MIFVDYIQDPFPLHQHYLSPTVEGWSQPGYHDGSFLPSHAAMTGPLGGFPCPDFGGPMLHDPHAGYHSEFLSVFVCFQPLVDDFSFNCGCRRFCRSASWPNVAGG